MAGEQEIRQSDEYRQRIAERTCTILSPHPPCPDRPHRGGLVARVRLRAVLKVRVRACSPNPGTTQPQFGHNTAPIGTKTTPIGCQSTQSQHSHSTVTAQSQHRHTVTATGCQSAYTGYRTRCRPCDHTGESCTGHTARHGSSTVPARSQHSPSTVTAQSQSQHGANGAGRMRAKHGGSGQIDGIDELSAPSRE